MHTSLCELLLAIKRLAGELSAHKPKIEINNIELEVLMEEFNKHIGELQQKKSEFWLIKCIMGDDLSQYGNLHFPFKCVEYRCNYKQHIWLQGVVNHNVCTKSIYLHLLLPVCCAAATMRDTAYSSRKTCSVEGVCYLAHLTGVILSAPSEWISFHMCLYPDCTRFDTCKLLVNRALSVSP